ncbi:hypothetical protein BC828DRAFT_374576 [Blastocladiella britannica]|nr:hypothetical protein BC828DRAFT_374576 [Blastocladiella britannica]
MSSSLFRSKGRKVVAIGFNYANHARELGNALPVKPIVFLKPTSSYCPVGRAITIPEQYDVHHEVELGVVIGKPARRVSEANAMGHVQGYALAIDLTARDLQTKARAVGHPWTVAKGFDDFTPITDMVPASAIRDPHDLRLWLKVNGKMRQDGSTRDMIFRIPSLISYVSQIMTLEEGDVILTGTPSGVASIKPGDRVECAVVEDGVGEVLHGEWDVRGGHHRSSV